MARRRRSYSYSARNFDWVRGFEVTRLIRSIVVRPEPDANGYRGKDIFLPKKIILKVERLNLDTGLCAFMVPRWFTEKKL